MSNQFAIVRKDVDTILAEYGAADMQPLVLAQAAVMKVDRDLLEIPENVGELIKSAQYTRKYGFMPGIDLHMMPFNTKVKRQAPNGKEVEVWEKRISLVVGEQAYKKSARVQAAKERDYIDIETEELTREEFEREIAKREPAAELTDRCCGVRARVISLSAAKLYQAMGRPYDPEWSYGFCLIKGTPRTYNGKKSYPNGDENKIPNQRGPVDVAKRRAVKAACMVKYGLVPIDDRTPDQRDAEVLTASVEDAEDERYNVIAQDTPQHYEDDGDILYATEDTPRNNGPVDAEYREADEQPAVELDGTALQFSNWCKTKDHPESRPATEKQYGFLSSIIREITGEDCADAVLSALLGRKVSGDAEHVPSGELARKLIDWLRKFEGRGDEKKIRQDYREDYAAVIVEIGELL